MLEDGLQSNAAVMELRIFELADELYAEMRRRGFQIRNGSKDGRDNGLFEKLCLLLNCNDDQLATRLREHLVSAKDFLIAFIRVAEPFSRMFQEIWHYLSSHAAPKAEEQLSIRFGLPEDGSSEELDLENFRRYMERWESFRQLATISVWDHYAVKELFELGAILRENLPWSTDIIGYYMGQSLDLAEVQTSGHQMTDVVSGIRDLFQEIIDEYAKLGDQAELADQELKAKAQLLTDLLPGWSQIFNNLSAIPTSDLDQALSYFKSLIEPLLSKREKSIAQLVRFATDILDLPFWKYRWHTYEIWCTVASLKALAKLKPIPIVNAGRIALDGYSTTIVAEFANAQYKDACAIIQEQTPISIGDKKAMKPDLRICYDKALGNIDNTAGMIEFKQRHSIEKSHVEEVAVRYTKGAPRSVGLIITNYDEAGLQPLLPASAIYLEGFQPCNPTVVAEFTRRLSDIVSKAGLLKSPDVLLIDISSSMGNAYKDPLIISAIESCLQSNDVEVYCFNEKLFLGSAQNFLELKTYGSTDLLAAWHELQQVSPEIGKLLIVSDGDYVLPDDLTEKLMLRECTPDELPAKVAWLLG